jgi:hypothetical protein
MYEQKYNRYKFKYLCLQLQKAGYNPIKDGKITDADFSINFNAAAFAVIDCPGEGNERADVEQDCSYVANPIDKSSPTTINVPENSNETNRKTTLKMEILVFANNLSNAQLASLTGTPLKNKDGMIMDFGFPFKLSESLKKFLKKKPSLEKEELIQLLNNNNQEELVNAVNATYDAEIAVVKQSEERASQSHQQADIIKEKRDQTKEFQTKAPLDMKEAKKEKCKRTKTLQYVASMFLAMLYNRDKCSFELNINSMINSKVGNCQYKTDEKKTAEEKKKEKKNHLTKYFIRVINKINTNLKDLPNYLKTDFSKNPDENEKDQHYGNTGTDKLLHNTEYAIAHLVKGESEEKSTPGDYYTSTSNPFFSEENLKKYLHFIQDCNLEVIEEDKTSKVKKTFKVEKELVQVKVELPIYGETQSFDKDTKCVDEYDKFVKCQKQLGENINSTKNDLNCKTALNECRKLHNKDALTDLVFKTIKPITINLLKI